MATDITSTYSTLPIELYVAYKKDAIFRRQNNRYTHGFTIPIKSPGTALLLLRSNSALSEEALAEKIKAGNALNDEYGFDLTYYQILASCSLTNTLVNNPDRQGEFTGTLTLNYRTTVTAPSGASTPATELFVANSLLARAARQSSRTTDGLQTEIMNDEEEGSYVYLVLMAAKEDGEGDMPYIFKNEESEDEEVDENELAECVTIKDFLNTPTEKDNVDDINITLVRVLGYFPKDQPDFEQFISNEYSITVTGSGYLTIAEKTTTTD